MADLAAQIQPQANTPVNRDFTPIAYYFDVILWSTRFNRGWRAVFQPLARLGFPVVVVAAFIAIGAIAALSRRRWGTRGVAGVAVGAMGFTMMALEILLLLGFQAIYGYVYHQLAILIATFMGGMALGSWWGLRRNGSLPVLQTIAAVAPLALCGLLIAMSSVASVAAFFVMSQIVFPALALLCGLLGGFQFPVAARIFFAGESRGAGTLYGLDLAGACLGAVTLSGYLVPVFGFVKTAVLMAVLNSVPVVGVMSSRSGRVERPPGM
jgi:spermidine synthase